MSGQSEEYKEGSCSYSLPRTKEETSQETERKRARGTHGLLSAEKVKSGHRRKTSERGAPTLCQSRRRDKSGHGEKLSNRGVPTVYQAQKVRIERERATAGTHSLLSTAAEGQARTRKECESAVGV